MKTGLPTAFALIAMIALSIALTGCEKAAPVLDALKEALDREPVEDKIAKIDPADIPPPPEPVAMEPIVNKDARVGILGYHDFTEEVSNNDMILNIEDFRRQLQTIKDADLPVISMREFLDWKQGKAKIPEKCVLLTIDDGWKATHTLALDVFKEFGYPFTIFLYKNYIGVGGRSMTHDEIRELAANGATICSHSVSHQNMSNRGDKSTEAYDAWILEELEESHRFLEEHFGDTGAVIKAFAYPYGIYNDRVIELATEVGYEAAFTVNGKKTIWEVEDMEIGRYVVHGTTLANFEPSINFGGGTVTSSGRKLMSATKTEEGEVEAPLVTVRPPDGSTIGNRLPLIEVDLSKLTDLDTESLSMRISGFGKVPHEFDPLTGLLSYQIPQRLRLDQCGVQVSFRHDGQEEHETIGWGFQVERLADYFSSDATEPGSNETIEPLSQEKESEAETPTASL
ncbi:MAG: polysaccharide deacetylase family protein [Verrucomicrobiales bacterium]|nr:polysaccharide deacetylase family protein [Verrucomicrobiales bacterium]